MGTVGELAVDLFSRSLDLAVIHAWGMFQTTNLITHCMEAHTYSQWETNRKKELLVMNTWG